ncbi:MAG: hypothetical protein LH649_05085 [Pseudanabaena sp. CAN_BIN31]|nr:hypothetical protein [Pseudanabaena sp. CAN_BIN31]
MKRRQFITLSTLGTATFTISLGALNPQGAQAIIFLFLLKSIAGPSLLNLALGGLALSALGSAVSQRRQRQEWFDARIEAQFAQREFIRRSFTDVTVAESSVPEYKYILGAFREESLGKSVGLVFPRSNRDQATMSAFSGPAPLGMAIAAEYLKKEENLSPADIRSAIMPRMSGGIEVTDWRTWNSSGFIAYPNSFSDTGTRIYYDAVEPRIGGFGTIDVTVNAHRRVRIPQIRVEFS